MGLLQGLLPRRFRSRDFLIWTVVVVLLVRYLQQSGDRKASLLRHAENTNVVASTRSDSSAVPVSITPNPTPAPPPVTEPPSSPPPTMPPTTPAKHVRTAGRCLDRRDVHWIRKAEATGPCRKFVALLAPCTSKGVGGKKLSRMSTVGNTPLMGA